MSDDNTRKIKDFLHAMFFDGYVIDLKNQTKVPLEGQLLVTSKEALSIMTDYYSRFEYSELADINSVLSVLKLQDIFTLPSKIE